MLEVLERCHFILHFMRFFNSPKVLFYLLLSEDNSFLSQGQEYDRVTTHLSLSLLPHYYLWIMSLLFAFWCIYKKFTSPFLNIVYLKLLSERT